MEKINQTNGTTNSVASPGQGQSSSVRSEEKDLTLEELELANIIGTMIAQIQLYNLDLKKK